MSLRTVRNVATIVVILAVYGLLVAVRRDSLAGAAIAMALIVAVSTAWVKQERSVNDGKLLRHLQQLTVQMLQGHPSVTLPLTSERKAVSIKATDHGYAILVALDADNPYSRAPKHCQASMYFFRQNGNICAYCRCAIRIDEDLNQILASAVSAGGLRILPRHQLVALISDMERWLND